MRSPTNLQQPSMKRKLFTTKRAKAGKSVEEKPTLYSLFNPSVYFLVILIVIVLGGLLSIVKIL